jgi:hypothetical protein
MRVRGDRPFVLLDIRLPILFKERNVKRIVIVAACAALVLATSFVTMSPQKAHASIPSNTVNLEYLLKSPAPNNMSQQPQLRKDAAICQTPIVWCVIGGIWIPGTPCFCATQWGPSPGIVTG